MGIRLNRLAVTFAAPILIAAGPSQPPLTSADLAKLVDAKPGGPGCAVAIVQDGKLAMAEAFGLADVETKRPARNSTSIRLNSTAAKAVQSTGCP
jgi:CubicO group peptidase (beta-lactamase class C family)